MTDIETFCQSTSVNQTERSSKSTDQTQVKELLDFSLNIIPGLYRCTADEMFFEIIEGNTISRAYLSFNNPTLSYKIISSPFSEYSLNYYCSIHIFHQDCQTIIKIPAHRSYNPTGTVEYVTHSQFIFGLKIAAALVKAAISGASESELSYLKNCIVPLQSYSDNKIMIYYMFIQVKAACYRKIIPPSFPEYLSIQIMKGTIVLREDAKEYLENYLMFSKGEAFETKLPSQYYSGILKNDKRLSWESRIKYVELENKANKPGRVLRLLPQMAENMQYTEIGMDYKDMNKEISKLVNDFESSIEKLYECNIM